MCRLSLRSARPLDRGRALRAEASPLPAELWPTEAFQGLTGFRSAEGVPVDYSTFQVTGFPPARGPSGRPMSTGPPRPGCFGAFRPQPIVGTTSHYLLRINS